MSDEKKSLTHCVQAGSETRTLTLTEITADEGLPFFVIRGHFNPITILNHKGEIITRVLPCEGVTVKAVRPWYRKLLGLLPKWKVVKS